MVYEDTNVYNDVYYNVNMVPDVTSCEIRPPPPHVLLRFTSCLDSDSVTHDRLRFKVHELIDDLKKLKYDISLKVLTFAFLYFKNNKTM